jgi:hypothetical protein
MPYRITRVDIWTGTLRDQPGGLAGKLEALSRGGANLEFVLSRRAPDRPGRGVARGPLNRVPLERQV